MIRKKVKHIYFKSFIDNADIINTHNYFTSYSEFFKMNYLLNHTIPGALNLQDAQAKENLMSEVYLSQGYAHRIFDHMVPYENFIRYKDWYFGA